MCMLEILRFKDNNVKSWWTNERGTGKEREREKCRRGRDDIELDIFLMISHRSFN